MFVKLTDIQKVCLLSGMSMVEDFLPAELEANKFSSQRMKMESPSKCVAYLSTVTVRSI
nr:MAG TPA: hypothetical protein [Caudoviricetes sp.]